jgi:hypothetical protein
MPQNPSIDALIEKLTEVNDLGSNQHAFVGFDGYVDHIQKVVKAAGSDYRTYFDTITNVSHHIAAAAGRSAQLELRTQESKMGGNAPIMSHALGCLGIENDCISMMGDDEIHPVFKRMHSNCALTSIGPAAVSHALEFDDGKLILSEVSSFDVVDLDYIIRLKSETFITDVLRVSKLIALVDWANMPQCTALWNGLYDLVKSHSLTNRIFFFDLCDPSKRTSTEILEVLHVIGQFSGIGKVVLGLNENEALKVYAALHSVNTTEGDSIKELQKVGLLNFARCIFEKLTIDQLLIHPVDRSVVITKEAQIEVEGRVVRKPRILTGGGDNLNAGFCFGLLSGFSVEECMLTGMAASGAYVKNGFSPSIPDLITYLKAARRSK